MNTYSLLFLPIIVYTTLGGVPFEPLGHLPGPADTSTAHGVSADGAVVVGWSASAAGPQAFRWTEVDGMVPLGDLPGGPFESAAYGLSGDGAAVVGAGRTAAGYEAFRWTQAEGLVSLGDLPGGATFAQANAASFDGSVIVGTGFGSYFQPFIWTAATGIVGIGPPTTVGNGGFATDVSDDGSAVVGYRQTTTTSEAYRWTAATGFTNLGDFPGGSSFSEAMGVSADGTVVTGYGFSETGYTGFRWTEASGLVPLGDLPGDTAHSIGRAASSSGRLVIGVSDSGVSHDDTFVWSSVLGMQSLRDVLTGLGADLSAWSQISATAASSNGRVIVGYGLHDGIREAWIARLPSFSPIVFAGGGVSGAEGGMIALGAVTFVDPDEPEPHVAMVDWGDGSGPEPAVVDDLAGTVADTHVYADNGGFPVSIMVSDGASEPGESVLMATIANVAPVLDAIDDVGTCVGGLVNLPPAVFVDAGTLDTHAAELDWDGDLVFEDTGSVQQSPAGPPGDLGGASGSVFAGHVFATPGVFHVTVRVVDDDGDDDQMGFNVSVFDSGSGDVNADGFVNGDDIAAFMDELMVGGPAMPSRRCAADMDANGDVDELDVPLFAARLLAP